MQFLCLSQALAEGQSLSLKALHTSVFAVRKNGQVYLYRNRCPHRGVPLNWQPDDFLDDSHSLIRCASHGALFTIEDGQCVAGPCAGKELESVACIENSEGIWADL